MIRNNKAAVTISFCVAVGVYFGVDFYFRKARVAAPSLPFSVAAAVFAFCLVNWVAAYLCGRGGPR